MSSSSSSRSICHECARHRQLGIADRRRPARTALRPGQAALVGVGPVRGDVALVEHVGERGRVVEVAGDAERLLHELLAAGRVVRVVERDGEPHQQTGAQRATVGAKRLQPLLEHGDELVVDDAGRQPEAAEAEGRLRQQLRVVDAPPELDRGDERLAGGVAAGLHERLPARQQQLPAAAVVRLGQHVERDERGVEEVGGALVGQRDERLVAGALGVVERLAGIVDGRGLDEVVGEHRLARRRALERLADRGMQSRAARRRQIAVERFADEAVREPERGRRVPAPPRRAAPRARLRGARADRPS
jgi:hypothetical protein